MSPCSGSLSGWGLGRSLPGPSQTQASSDHCGFRAVVWRWTRPLPIVRLGLRGPHGRSTLRPCGRRKLGASSPQVSNMGPSARAAPPLTIPPLALLRWPPYSGIPRAPPSPSAFNLL